MGGGNSYFFHYICTELLEWNRACHSLLAIQSCTAKGRETGSPHSDAGELSNIEPFLTLKIMRVRNLMFMAMMLLATPVCLCLASCSDDDDEKIQEPVKEPSVATDFKMVVDVTLPADLFVVADVYLGYTDAEGKQVLEQQTSPEIKKTVIASVELEKVKENGLGYAIFLQSKHLETHEVDHYMIGTGTHSSAWQILDQNGDVMQGEPYFTKYQGSVGADKIEDYLERRAKLQERAYKISADGKIVESTIAWEFNFI